MTSPLTETLATKSCKSCSSTSSRLSDDEVKQLAAQTPRWNVVESHHITRTFKFADFKTALEFVNRLGAIVEAENHHPDVVLKWGIVEVLLFTHSVGGLSENDFIVAAKIDALG